MGGRARRQDYDHDDDDGDNDDDDKDDGGGDDDDGDDDDDHVDHHNGEGYWGGFIEHSRYYLGYSSDDSDSSCQEKTESVQTPVVDWEMNRKIQRQRCL
ncbi:hypothetical protein BGZ65_006254 [Modicella reniformis]|uniref:Uncharacterized protein n=1 Tax=Modicella reniformis TaxID=1440133 RepID=A0A9P6MG79_9FUNG|nr:hypothetical protein BGZ65_006254 [Modicella reniformis]